MTVLRYIANKTTRFQTFVANRISEIRDCTRKSQWRYVEYKLNPADIASCGAGVVDLVQADSWLHGPGFLSEPETKWPEQPTDLHLTLEDDAEVKRLVNVVVIQSAQHPIELLLTRCSSWFKVRRVTALVLKVICTLRAKAAHRKVFMEQNQKTKETVYRQQSSLNRDQPCIMLDQLKEAEKLIIKVIQQLFYPVEYTELAKSTVCGVKPTSPLYKLDPYMKDTILRVGGRLSRSTLPYNSMHQILIPHKSSLAKMIFTRGLGTWARMLLWQNYEGTTGYRRQETLSRRFWASVSYVGNIVLPQLNNRWPTYLVKDLSLIYLPSRMWVWTILVP